MSLPAATFIVWYNEDNPELLTGIGAPSSLTYEDSDGEDNLATIEFSAAPNNAADDPRIQAGQKILVSWGRGGSMTDPVLLAVEQPSMKYSAGIKLILTCRDVGGDMKGLSIHKVHPKSQTLTEIVEGIANDWGLDFDIEPYDFEFDHVQKKESDWRYIFRIAKSIGYKFWIDGRTLHLKKSAVQPPAVIVTYGDGEIVHSFEPKTKKQEQAASQKEVTVEGFDIDKREPVKATATAETDDTPKQTGGIVEVEANTGNVKEINGERRISPSGNLKRIEQEAHGARKEKIEKQQEASLVLTGYPFLRAGMYIDIDGVAVMYAGTWHIAKSSHRVKSDGYKVALALDRETTGKINAPGIGEVPVEKVEAQEATLSGKQLRINANDGSVLGVVPTL